MQRTATATWSGHPETGAGSLSSESGALSGNRYSAKGRFGDGRGTNPEELIGAAHAGCFSMALSKLLDEEDIRAERIDTTATVSLEEDDGPFRITGVHLQTRVEAPGADPAIFERAINEAKKGCPVSQALSTPIDLEATLVN